MGLDILGVQYTFAADGRQHSDAYLEHCPALVWKEGLFMTCRPAIKGQSARLRPRGTRIRLAL